MIKLLEDLLIEATTNPNVPGSLVAGLRKAVEDVRTGSVKGKTFAFSGVLPTLSRDEACVRIEEAGGVIVSAVSAKLDYLVAGSEAGSKLLKALELGVPVIGEKQLQAMLPGVIARLKGMITPDLLPPPFDSQEEAQRAAGIWPQEAEPVGHVVTLESGELLQRPDCWVPCDKDGWVSAAAYTCDLPEDLKIEWRDGAGTSDWRPKPSAIDEMAEQMKRWAAPTREEVAKSHAEMWEHLTAAVPVESAVYTKPTNPKDAAATDRVPLGLLSPIAKAHWALAQHCGRAKYGAWNWREAGVRASIYIDAIGRHTDGYLSGETYDPADGTHHLGNIMACCAILLEAEAAGKLTDDRPPTLDMRPTYAEVQRRLADLTTKYADRNPKHWTR